MTKGDPNRNMIAALSYLLLFITGIVVLMVEKNDKFIRFHAMQSTVIFGSLFILNMIIGIVLRPILFLSVIANIANSLIWLGIIIIWVVSMIKAYQGELFKWPLAGDFAEKRVK